MDIKTHAASAISKNSYDSNSPVPAPVSTSTVVPDLATSASTSSSDLLHKDKYELSLSDMAVRKAIEKANKALDGFERKFEYSIHEKTGDVMVKVINAETNEIVREIPNEKFLDLMDKLQELVGINIDEKR